MTVAVRGVGVDTVEIGAFAASLAEPGTRFTTAFSPIERRQCRERAESSAAAPGPHPVGAEVLGAGSSSSSSGQSTRIARHLAARWAAKEAVVKAWSSALYGSAPPISPDLLVWSEIETVCDAWGRPAVRLGGEVARQVAATVGEGARWHVSLSHDGDSALAFVVLEGPVAG
ncbi:4'-phosphopantetheinyl transferase superfamily protein [Dietzia sp. SLG310A2-38A2]|uniref:4'-phosphopantetheinyl transferase superfamily protein n=1 Tax=unclassified Dietzia TaxID=2617939 RepID=UPI0015FE64C3|nr:holo-ACP synthase [Dietzia sp. SLG310A2-38A2]MBB1054442.1 holo-ACP synthase [Dietzia sp. B44]